ncbi:hypothetical protein D9758_011447 [Tetrapyrgos nigripes]|uniref:Uncharacterized protein n=1 Tax=Tetrapyrgos nigripes TaxID=182062 RepID=A0A8H5FR93_9AGAR|nr:hypothetical protein D9758_011447 [Tetrapyrgos nigripes]
MLGVHIASFLIFSIPLTLIVVWDKKISSTILFMSMLEQLESVIDRFSSSWFWLHQHSLQQEEGFVWLTPVIGGAAVGAKTLFCSFQPVIVAE